MLPTYITNLKSSIPVTSTNKVFPNNACIDLKEKTSIATDSSSTPKFTTTAQYTKKCGHLYKDVIQQMIRRLLTETQIPKEKLISTLGITTTNLEQLCSKQTPNTLISKVNLPLIKLYCKTKF